MMPNRRAFTPRTLLLAAGLAAASLAPCVTTLAPAAMAASDALKVKAVTVTGNSLVPTDALIDVIPFHSGDTITRADIQKGADAVGGVYHDKNIGARLETRATMLGNTVKITYVISNESAAPAPTKTALVIDSVGFEGNTKVPTEKLAAAIKLHPGSTVSNEDIAADVAAIQQVYKDANVGDSLQPVATYPTPGHVALVYKITEK